MTENLASPARSTESLNRATPPAHTYGRTDVRTENSLTTSEHLADLNARDEYDGMAAVGDVIAAGLRVSDERHPVVRKGERQEIPTHTRHAIWFRDKGCCELCGTGKRIVGAYHLDHIKPWSAGGSDDSTNLRLLCETHNMDRSNHVDPTERPRRAVTWWCHRCHADDLEPWIYTPAGFPACPLPAHKNPVFCRVMRGYLSARKRTGAFPDWHRRIDMGEFTKPAYCAHCNLPGLTDKPL